MAGNAGQALALQELRRIAFLVSRNLSSMRSRRGKLSGGHIGLCGVEKALGTTVMALPLSPVEMLNQSLGVLKNLQEV